MGEKFIGSQDLELLAAGVRSADGAGAFVEFDDAENVELELAVSAVSGGTHSLIVETDLGTDQVTTDRQNVSVVHTFTMTDTTDQSAIKSLGSFPGGKRIRARWVVGESETFNAVLTARETRSGLG